MEQLLLTFGLVVVFYLIIPGIGAFDVRGRWRRFRRDVLLSSSFRIAEYEQFHEATTRADGTELGSFRFFGTLEAIQGDDTIWLKNGNVTVAADMTEVRVCLLHPDNESGRPLSAENPSPSYPDLTPQIISWSRMGTLSEGTRFYVGGHMEVQRGLPTFRRSTGSPLIVVIYEGNDESLLARCIWSGRQRNEYWNQFTPASLLTGAFALLVLSYFYLRSPLLRLPVLFSLSLSAVPVMPLLPPGVALFFLYRYWWRRGRYFRAQRDLVRLPIRYFAEGEFPGTAELPDGSRYCCRVVPATAVKSENGEPFLIREVPGLRSGEDESKLYLFGVEKRNADATEVVRPADPMAEHVAYRQEPAKLAAACETEARRLESRSGIAFAVGLLVNAYAVFLLLSNIVR
ncbi:MAG TPA: hypothetical protein VMW87_10965 [Spirochaetia bacterium]|nr:hypothetical protein [Spirochaetia bacterium]